jgi:hypothetical protein
MDHGLLTMDLPTCLTFLPIAIGISRLTFETVTIKKERR